MSYRSLAVAVLLSLLSFCLEAGTGGTWSAEERANGKVQLHLRYDGSNVSTSIPLENFAGLSKPAIRSESSQPVSFRLQRDAGTLHFEGTFTEGEGAGHFQFEPNSSFLSDLRELGVDVSSRRNDKSDSSLMTLALFDVSRAMVRDLYNAGYEDLDLDDLVSMKIHGVSTEFIQELRELGYDALPIDKLISLRIHGASAEYIREMAGQGFRPDADELISMRIHGVQPVFVRELRSFGYQHLSTEDLVSMRIHGVTTQFVKDLKSLGYQQVEAEDLIAMRIHGVTTEFIRELREAGYENVPVEKLIELKIHGVDAAFIRSLKRKNPS